ncbi:MAG: FecR domain-containing protein [Gammaproteobacteria bacterium]|nr:FecR domain-containing protein [Gammaproteobacteria bacterium]MBQ0775540.1 FecR domain-containing protein [Gammaproteobacteria bacterium]
MQQISRLNMGKWLLLGLLAVAMPLQAAVEAGKILYSRGVVSIVDELESARGGKSGAQIFEGDRVVTGRGALAQIRLSDGALIALRGSSDYQIQKQSFNEEEDLYEQAGQLFTGWMRSITGAIGKKYPNNVTQKTSVATIGIRGTVYQVIHIPPEGLPGYAGEEPGTYVLLEEGSVEMTGEGGKRLMKPGDVVFIPAAGGVPILVPQKVSLFKNPEADTITFVEAEDLEFSEELNTGLEESLNSNEAPFVRLASMGVVNTSPYNGVKPTTSTSNHVFAGSGAGRVLTGLTIQDSDFVTSVYTADAGATPFSTGYRLLSNGSAINWGQWAESDYSVFDPDAVSEQPVAFGVWQYMVASNLVSESMATSGLNGSATFNYVGGTPLRDDSAGFVHHITGGTVSVNFGFDAIDINLTSDLAPIVGNCTSGCISQLYQGGLAISGNNGSDFYSGNMGGAFVGNGQGLITTIELSGGANEFYSGTAAFEAGATAQAPPAGL